MGGRALHISGTSSNGAATSTTRHFPAGNGWADVNVNTNIETDFQKTYRTAGTLRSGWCYVSSNGISATSTIKSRINAANGNISISITASTTGVFEDTSNTDSVSVGDEVCFQLVTGASGSSINVRNFSTEFESSTYTTCIWELTTITGSAAASTTYYYTPAGRWQGANITANNAKIVSGCDGTWYGLFVDIFSNGRTTNTTFQNRINAIAGSMSVVVGSGGTGVYEDTTNNDIVSIGDELDQIIGTGTGSGTILVVVWATEFETTDKKSITIAGNASSGMSVSSNLTRYLTAGGAGTWDATEANMQAKMFSEMEVSYLSVYSSANTNAATNSVTIRDDASDTAVTVSIGSSASGRFTDSSNTATVAAGSLINHKCVTGNGGGTLTFRNLEFTLEDLTPDPGGSLVDLIGCGVVPFAR